MGEGDSLLLTYAFVAEEYRFLKPSQGGFGRHRIDLGWCRQIFFPEKSGGSRRIETLSTRS